MDKNTNKKQVSIEFKNNKFGKNGEIWFYCDSWSFDQIKHMFVFYNVYIENTSGFGNPLHYQTIMFSREGILKISIEDPKKEDNDE